MSLDIFHVIFIDKLLLQLHTIFLTKNGHGSALNWLKAFSEILFYSYNIPIAALHRLVGITFQATFRPRTAQWQTTAQNHSCWNNG